MVDGNGQEQRPCSIVAQFQRLCERSPEARLFSFVDEKGEDHETLTVGQLAAAADEVARALKSWGLTPGDRAVLVYPPSLNFVKSLVGCLVAGVVPVPVCPPDPARWGQDAAAFRGIVASTEARAALTDSGYDQVRLAQHQDLWPGLPWHQTDRSPAGPAAISQWHVPASLELPAFLQYTSGSTGSPKGVIVTHGNLWHELRANARDLGLGPHTTGVFWVPHFHDLGLICVILNTVVGHSFNTRLLSPLTFLKRPAVWGDVLSRVRATHTAAPNFGYDLLVRKTTPEIRRGWDLSSLRVAALAGEPVRPATVRTFRHAFSESKFPPDALFSTYGLAECTVTVTMGGRTELSVDRHELEAGRAVPLAAGSGDPATVCFSSGQVTKPEASVRVVDPDTARPCPAGQVGEIWVDSPTKAAGYWGQAEESADRFRARVAGEHSGREYLRTGDLGFFFQDELYITGRRKDVIIIHGRNLYPQDIEESVRGSHPVIRPGGLAAFSVPTSASDRAVERLVMLVEINVDVDDATRDEVLQAVRKRIYDDHRIPCHTVVLGRPGTIRKTTSGKIRRGECRTAFLGGEIDKADETIGVFVLAGSVPSQRRSDR